MSDIRTDMPVLARHEGAWEGEYLHMDTHGNILDRHRSRVTCQFPASGEHAYHQINVYTWPDGRRDELHFPATYRDRRIWWDTARIRGHAWEIDNRSIVLTWTRKDLTEYYLYEMIQLSADGTQRGRTWHWFESDVLVKRTCIQEHRVIR